MLCASKGPQDKCSQCGAKHWMDEKLTSSSLVNPVFGTCCFDGKVSIPLLTQPPLELWKLYNGTDPNSTHFLNYIGSYNNAFAMVSLAHKREDLGAGPNIFKIQGELRHRMGSLLPEPGRTPTYAQLYFQSSEVALEYRMGGNNAQNNGQQPHVRVAVMQILQDVIEQNHGYVQLYKTAYDRLQELGDVPNVYVKLCFSAETDQRRYNLPTANEVAMIVPGDGTQPTKNCDIILQTRAGPLKRIFKTNPAY